jgi:cyclohexyl-isocyanide hydratase
MSYLPSPPVWHSRAVKIQYLVYPGMTLLDLVGPAQIWAAFPEVETQWVAKRTGAVPTDAGLSVLATADFEHAWDAPDIFFVPGGLDATFALVEDEPTMRFVRSRERAGWITSVCTGSIVLAAAGLLTGYRATSHWFVRDALALFGATPCRERWVIDRNRATGGGVTAGVDFGLELFARIASEPMARMIQLQTEYAPSPPFRSGSPEEAAPETVAAVTAAWGPRTTHLRPLLEAAARRVAERAGG